MTDVLQHLSLMGRICIHFHHLIQFKRRFNCQILLTADPHVGQTYLSSFQELVLTFSSLFLLQFSFLFFFTTVFLFSFTFLPLFSLVWGIFTTNNIFSPSVASFFPPFISILLDEKERQKRKEKKKGEKSEKTILSTRVRLPPPLSHPPLCPSPPRDKSPENATGRTGRTLYWALLQWSVMENCSLSVLVLFIQDI